MSIITILLRKMYRLMDEKFRDLRHPRWPLHVPTSTTQMQTSPAMPKNDERKKKNTTHTIFFICFNIKLTFTKWCLEEKPVDCNILVQLISGRLQPDTITHWSRLMTINRWISIPIVRCYRYSVTFTRRRDTIKYDTHKYIWIFHHTNQYLKVTVLLCDGNIIYDLSEHKQGVYLPRPLALSVGNTALRCFAPDVLLVRGLGKTEY